MDWASHVRAFHASWIIKYAAHTAQGAWKDVLDEIMLYLKPRSSSAARKKKFPEMRKIFFCNMTKADKLRLLRNLPKKAIYIRQCITALMNALKEAQSSVGAGISMTITHSSPSVVSSVKLPPRD